MIIPALRSRRLFNLSLLRVYRMGRGLTGPLRALVRPIAKIFLERRGYPLAAPLRGCRMRGSHRKYREGVYEPELCRAMSGLVKPGWVCVDVGAYVGYFTLLLARLVGKHGRIVAFEPHPDKSDLLRYNVKANGFDARVKVLNAAVSDGSVDRVTLSRWESCFTIVSAKVDASAADSLEFMVQATALDAQFPSGDRVDLIKLDVEGAEADALSGMRRLLNEARPLVFVEFHDEVGWAGRQVLFTANYCLFDLHNARWLNSDLDNRRVYHCLAAPRERIPEVQADLDRTACPQPGVAPLIGSSR